MRDHSSLSGAETGLSGQRPEYEADATTADRDGYAPPRPCERTSEVNVIRPSVSPVSFFDTMAYLRNFT